MYTIYFMLYLIEILHQTTTKVFFIYLWCKNSTSYHNKAICRRFSTYCLRVLRGDFLYFVNNLKTVGCYCGVCRRCGFLPSGVHGAENRRSHVGPSATRRATHRHEASPIAAFIKGISLEYAGILYIETLKPGKHANGNSATPSVPGRIRARGSAAGGR